MNLIPFYAAYAAAALMLTVWLARTLFHNGAAFLADTFGDRLELANAVNRLLVTGFFMLNLGYAMFLMRSDRPQDATGAVENLASKFGILLVSLAAIHFLNLIVFNRVRAHGRPGAPPVPPTDVVFPPPAPPTPPTQPVSLAPTPLPPTASAPNLAGFAPAPSPFAPPQPRPA